jgi:uncharacterized protein YndB with AHSA1/START domain
VDTAAGAVRLERTLPAPRDQVWEALTDPARLHAWLAPVQEGRPGPGRTFVLRMNESDTATCTVTDWNPPHELGLLWDYTGEGPSELRLRLADLGGQTRLTLSHTRVLATAVRYGAGWHIHLDNLAAHLADAERTASGCAGDEFMAAYLALEPRYAAAASAAAGDGPGAGTPAPGVSMAAEGRHG